MNPLLLTLIVSLAGFFVVLLLPGTLARRVSLGISVVVFAISLALIGPVLEANGRFTLEVDTQWIADPAVRFHFGLDGMSLWLVLLSTFLTPIAILSASPRIEHRQKEFFALLLLLEFALAGVFSALDLILYYLFWELTLVPMILLIGIWGGGRRIQAGVKFFLYTFAGSVLMLAGIVYLLVRSGTSDYSRIIAQLNNGNLVLNSMESALLFLGFFAAFAVKIPIFPLHTWLPEAYTAAPASGSIMLAAVMGKMGAYGLLRFCLPMFPNAVRDYAGIIAILAIVGIVYGALVAIVQPNMKKLIAYSSVSHLGFIVLGIFSLNQQALDGAVYQMIAHGVSTGALFALAGMLEERRGSLEISDYGGIALTAPGLSASFMIVALASLGLPLLSNFVGEFLVLQGAAIARFEWAIFAAIGVVLSACYTLWFYQRTFFGAGAEPPFSFPDFSSREWWAVTPLLILIVWLGVGAQSFLPSMGATNALTLSQTRGKFEEQVRRPVPEVANAR